MDVGSALIRQDGNQVAAASSEEELLVGGYLKVAVVNWPRIIKCSFAGDTMMAATIVWAVLGSNGADVAAMV
jgi:hypothetical protein